MIDAALAEFDKHGDRRKDVWLEENNHPRSPKSGVKRRYEEGKGASNMVRWRIALAAKYGDRVQAVTMWGFLLAGDWGMLTPDLQPRPQFVAQAVMADALADAVLKTDHSTEAINLFEYKRSDGPLFAAWTNSGEQDVVFETKGQDLTVMDIMGNRRTVQGKNKLATVRLGTSPLYITGPAGTSVSKRR
jgi:hypothetical protein